MNGVVPDFGADLDAANTPTGVASCAETTVDFGDGSTDTLDAVSITTLSFTGVDTLPFSGGIGLLTIVDFDDGFGGNFDALGNLSDATLDFDARFDALASFDAVVDESSVVVAIGSLTILDFEALVTGFDIYRCLLNCLLMARTTHSPPENVEKFCCTVVV
jgi:hypothetical protein